MAKGKGYVYNNSCWKARCISIYVYCCSACLLPTYNNMYKVVI